MKDTLFQSNFSLNCQGILKPITKPLIMGIINATPDSFYEGSRTSETSTGLTKAVEMINAGATILDIGGYSSRPGASAVSETEETNRTVRLIQEIRAAFPNILISIDTFRANVAQNAIKAGANIINDISGGQVSPEIFKVASKHKAPYIMMHMKGNPLEMMKDTNYKDLMKDLILFFSTQIEKAKKAGLKDIIIDPGFGFSKTTSQNYEILKKMDLLHVLECPILVGISRKSMIYKTLNTTPEGSLNGTTVLNTIGLMKGASILRVHDVAEAAEIVELTQFIKD